ncbi:hypothetical protein [Paenirhodobacter populi]|uniref:UrcA family protein n=1 Tax=Paenirhodobacter populi TaxID=2306993 RepID=A0A443JVI7_9RHOB|nr:hypothetical protein [Sinirhodobacter populi]RWR24540.1 hypothetical protein D2T30_01135 [Sinirhodobacter populi]
MAAVRHIAGLVLPALLAGGMARAQDAAPEPPKEEIAYLGIETRMIDPELVEMRAALKGGASDEAITAYLRCAVAQYALIRGMDTARQIRTVVSERFGKWTGEAVYMIGKGHPRGFDRVEAQEMVGECAVKGIPTV